MNNNPVVGGVVIRPSPAATVKCRVVTSSVRGQTDPCIRTPWKHSRIIVGVPGRTVPARSVPTGTSTVLLAVREMSNPFSASDACMKTPIRICWPTGPENTGGGVGHGEVELAVVGSARHTSPVAAFAM